MSKVSRVMLSRHSSRRGRVQSLMLVIILVSACAPRVASAMARQPILTPTSAQWANTCIAKGGNKYICTAESILYDPIGQDITGLSLTIQYDPSIRIFDPANSGPLGIFSLGGDAPPPNSGTGTEPIHLLPGFGFTPGAPLPGSTLTYTNGSGFLTVDYHLAAPLTVSSDVNFFRLSFNLVNPVFIDLSQSTVTFMASGSGADFTTVSFSCTTPEGTGGCGSNNPSTGLTVNYALVPEPSTLLVLGVALVAGMLGRVCLRRSPSRI